MKHGFAVLGCCELFGEVSYGTVETLREARDLYRFVRDSHTTTEYERNRLRLVELVEREIKMDAVA